MLRKGVHSATSFGGKADTFLPQDAPEDGLFGRHKMQCTPFAAVLPLNHPLQVVASQPPARGKVKQRTVRHQAMPVLPACRISGKRSLGDPASTVEVVAHGYVE